MPPRLPLAVLVLASVTAGCAGLGGAGPWVAGGSTETLTPVSVPGTASPAASQSTARSDRTEVAPRQGIDPAGLVASHRRVLADETVRITVTERIVVNRTVVRKATYRRTLGADRLSYHTRIRRETTGRLPGATGVVEVATFYNGSVLATRYRNGTGGRPRYTYAEGSFGWTSRIAEGNRIEPLLRAFAGEYSVYAVGPSGTVFGAARITEPGALPTPPGTANPRDGEIVVEALSRGILRTVRVGYTVTVDRNETARIVRKIRVVDRDDALRTPEWIDAARAQAAGPANSARVTDREPSPSSVSTSQTTET